METWDFGIPNTQPVLKIRGLLQRQYGLKELVQVTLLLGLTFPDDHDMPTEAHQLQLRSLVALHVASQFSFPELAPGLRDRSTPTSGVTMPEATMNEDSQFVARQNDVRSSGQISAVETESKSVSVQPASYDQFRTGVRASNACHQGTSLRAHRRINTAAHHVSLEKNKSLGRQTLKHKVHAKFANDALPVIPLRAP